MRFQLIPAAYFKVSGKREISVLFFLKPTSQRPVPESVGGWEGSEQLVCFQGTGNNQDARLFPLNVLVNPYSGVFSNHFHHLQCSLACRDGQHGRPRGCLRGVENWR